MADEANAYVRMSDGALLVCDENVSAQADWSRIKRGETRFQDQ
jgi:hypothetical protein